MSKCHCSCSSAKTRPFNMPNKSHILNNSPLLQSKHYLIKVITWKFQSSRSLRAEEVKPGHRKFGSSPFQKRRENPHTHGRGRMNVVVLILLQCILTFLIISYLTSESFRNSSTLSNRIKPDHSFQTFPSKV